MSRYINEKDVYNLFPQSGIERLHIAQIDVLPRVDVVEVKHGYWKKRIAYPMGYNCSECNNSETYKSPFCRLCGAKMDGTPKERGGEK